MNRRPALLAPLRWGWRRRHDHLLPIALLFAALAFGATFADGADRWIADFRFEHNHNPGRWLAQMASIWDPGRGFGTNRSEVFIAPTLFFGLFRGVGLSAAVVERLFHTALFVTVGTGMVALLRVWTRRIGLMHLTAGLYVMFSPFAVAFLLPSGLFLGYSLLPWILLLATRGIRGDGVWWSSAALVLLIVSVGAVDRGGLVFSTGAVCLLALYLVVVERSASLRSAWAWAWRTAALGIPALAVSLAGLALTAEITAQDLRETELADAVNIASSWPESFRGLGFWLLYLRDPSGWAKPATLPYSNERWLYVATFVVPIIALAALGLVKRRERLFFGILLSAGLLLMVGTNPIDDPSPWGQTLRWLYSAIPPTQILRNGYKAGALSTIAHGALFGMAAAELSSRWRQRQARERSGSAGPLLVTAAVVAILGGITQPIWSGGLYQDTAGYDTIPQYQLDAMAWLDDQPGDARAFFAPGGHRLGFRWGSVNDDIIDTYLHRTSLIDVALHTSRPLNADIISALDGALLNRAYEPGLATNLGQRLGIEYVVLRNDIDWQVWGQARPADYEEFRNDPAVERVAVFGFMGENTTAFGDISIEAGVEQQLPPVEIYRIADPGPMVTVLGAQPPLLVSGDGDALPLLGRNNRLEGTQPVQFTGSMNVADIRDAVAAGSPILITDTNRRAVEYITISPQRGATLSATDDPERSVHSLFGIPNSQTLADYGDAQRIDASTSVSISGDAAPWNRPALGIDGSTETSWLVGGLSNPIGERFRVLLDKPTTTTGIRLTAAAPVRPTARRLTGATIILSDGTALDARLDDGEYNVALAPTVIDWIEVVIARVDGDGVDPVGFSSLEVTGVDLRERLRLPSDVFRAADVLAGHPIGYAFERIVGDGPVDIEREMRRSFATIDRSSFEIEGHLQLGAAVPESLLVQLEGRELSATGSSRFRGLMTFRGNQAVDGDLETAWVVNATGPVQLDLAFPAQTIASLDVQARFGAGFSRPSVVTALVDGRQVARTEVGPAPCSDTQCSLGIPLVLEDPGIETTALSLTFESADGAASFERPIRVDEVELNGVANQPTRPSNDSGCRAGLITIDGTPIDIRFDAIDASLVLGRRTPFSACRLAKVEAGEHDFESSPGIVVDDVTLLPAAFAVSDRARGATDVAASDPTSWEGTLDARAGSLLVLRQSFHRSWRATVDGKDLGEPMSIDGFNGWELPSTATSANVRITLVDQRWYELAQLISLLAIVGTLTVLVVAPRPTSGVLSPATIAVAEPSLGPVRQAALIMALAAAGYLVGRWLGAALCGATAFSHPGTERRWLSPAVLAAVTLSVAAGIGAARDDFGLENFNGLFALRPQTAVTAGMLAAVLLIAGVLHDTGRERLRTLPSYQTARTRRLRWDRAWTHLAASAPILAVGFTAALATALRGPTISGNLDQAIRSASLGRPITTTSFPGAAIVGAFTPFGPRFAYAALIAIAVGSTVRICARLALGRLEHHSAFALALGAAVGATLLVPAVPLEWTLGITLVLSVAALSANRSPSVTRSAARVALIAAATVAHPVGILAWVGHVSEPGRRRAGLTATATLVLLAPWIAWLLVSS